MAGKSSCQDLVDKAQMCGLGIPQDTTWCTAKPGLRRQGGKQGWGPQFVPLHHVPQMSGVANLNLTTGTFSTKAQVFRMLEILSNLMLA